MAKGTLTMALLTYDGWLLLLRWFHFLAGPRTSEKAAIWADMWWRPGLPRKWRG